MQNRFVAGACAVVCMLGLASAPVKADSVLYDSANFISGQESFVQTFAITTPGTLTVSLQSVTWLDSLSNLTFFVTSTTGLVGSAMSEGTGAFDILAGTYYAHWFGSADGQYKLGVDELKILFQPQGVTAVPLPATLLLLLAGLGVLFGWQRRAGDFGAVVPQT